MQMLEVSWVFIQMCYTSSLSGEMHVLEEMCKMDALP